jgi:cobalt-zinc-cadmium efflux system outer membrane protein
MARTWAVLTALVVVTAAEAATLGSAHAQTSLTLEQALAEALTRNPVLVVERNEVDIAAGGLKQARVYPLNPELELEGGAGTGRALDEGNHRDINSKSVGLSQTIWLRGQRGLRVRSAEAGLARADAGVRDVERQVIGDVLRAFSEVLVGQERVALAREIVSLTTEVLDAAEKLLEAGAVPQLDVFRAKVELEKATNRLVTAERNLRTAQRELALLVGRGAEQSIRAEGALTFATPHGELPALQQAALERRPDLTAARAAVRSADADLALVRAEQYFPEVKVGLKYDEARDFDTVNRSGLLTLSIPLPLFNRRQGDVDRAVADLKKQEAQVALVQRRIEKEVASAYHQVLASSRITEAYTGRILPDQDRNFRLLREGYNLGEFRLTDVFVGQREFIDAREAYLDAATELNAAIAELYRALNRRP